MFEIKYIVCTNVRIFGMKVTESNEGQLKQKQEMYDKNVTVYKTEKKKKAELPLISNF